MTYSFLGNLRAAWQLRHQPSVLKAWLPAARKAWILAGLFLFVGVFIWPAVVAWLSNLLTPASVEVRLMGILKNHHDNPLRPWLEGILWLGFVGVAVREILHAAVQALPAAHARLALNHINGTTADDATMINSAMPKSAGGNTPEKTPRYVLEQELGRGAMGVVHRAQDTLLHRTVALKTLASRLADDADLRARFLREARAVARLNHRGIVQIYDLLDDADGCRIAMEFVNGPTLLQLSEKKPQALVDVLHWGRHIADALATAHEHGIIHRDLKPANILMERASTPRLTDFGLAKFIDDAHETSSADPLTGETQIGTVMGSPAYMSPEQSAGQEVDYHTDIYSFGILLYELLTGKTPFSGESSAVLAAQITQPPPDITVVRPDIPPTLATLIAQLLEKKPEARPASMRTVHDTLMRIRGTAGDRREYPA